MEQRAARRLRCTPAAILPRQFSAIVIAWPTLPLVHSASAFIMNFRISRALLLTLPAIVLCASAAAHAADIVIANAFARPTIAQQPAAAAYLTIVNKGKTADRLVAVTTPAADSAAVHSMKMEGDVMKMREIDDLPLPAGASVAMKPGMGYHIMLMKLKAPLKLGDSFPMTLQFEKAGKVDVNVKVLNPEARSDAMPMRDMPKH